MLVDTGAGDPGGLALSSVPVAGVSVNATTVETTPTTIRWRADVARAGWRSGDVDVVFVVTRGGATVATGTLVVTPVSPPDPGGVVEVTVSTELDQLQEARPQEVVIVVRNTSSGPVTVDFVSGVVSADVRVCLLPDAGTGTGGGLDGERCDRRRMSAERRDLDRGEVSTYWFVVEATERTRTGRHQILFVTKSSYLNDSGDRASTETVVKHAFTHSVLGEAEFLTAVGVPSFLLLPGFLVVMAYRIPARRAQSRGVELPPLDVSAPEFLAISATLSVVAIPTYWLITTLLGRPHTYLAGYGVRDLLAVWIGSVVVGFGAFAIPWAVTTTRTRLRTPTPHDSPLTVVERLARSGSPLVLPQVRFEVTGGEIRQGFLVVVPGGQSGTAWCLPRIRLSLSPDTGDDRRAEVQAAMTGPAEGLWSVVRRRSDVSLSWDSAGLAGPTLVRTADILTEITAAPLVTQSLSAEAELDY
ncbi:hypothetical protein ABTZ99_19735 [Actinosynnema sp. NPDC002837]